MSSQDAAAVPAQGQGGGSIIGNNDSRLHDSRKVWIASDEVTIVGAYGPGTSLEITSNMKMPFEGLTAGRGLDVASAGLQATTGMTMVSTLNSRQTWEGNSPHEFTVELKLYALSDTEQEVMKPLAALEYMIAPDVGEFWGFGGEITKTVQVSIGKRIIYNELCLKSISLPFDKETDSKGNFVRCTVNLTFSSIQMISKDMLKKGYGLKARY